MWWVFGLVWVGCGVLAYGCYVDYFQGSYPELAEEDYVADRIRAGLIGSLLGPAALISIVICVTCLFHKKPLGWRL